VKSKLGLAVLVLAVLVAVVLMWPQPTAHNTAPGPTTPPAAATSAPAAAERAYVYAGLPRATAAVTVLSNKGYVVGYSDTRRNPLWVAYRVFRTNTTTISPRPARFSPDGRTQSTVSHDDYTRSGHDRGHMAPNYAIATRYGRAAQIETFLMSNICPQKPDLNRYAWKELEALVATRYANQLEEVWIICGPIFDDQIAKLESGVEIPDAFYKIVVDEKDGKVRVLAFVMPQGVSSADKDMLPKFLTSVDEVERQTGLNFLHELPDDVEDRVEAEQPKGLW